MPPEAFRHYQKFMQQATDPTLTLGQKLGLEPSRYDVKPAARLPYGALATHMVPPARILDAAQLKAQAEGKRSLFPARRAHEADTYAIYMCSEDTEQSSPPLGAESGTHVGSMHTAHADPTDGAASGGASLAAQGVDTASETLVTHHAPDAGGERMRNSSEESLDFDADEPDETTEAMDVPRVAAAMPPAARKSIADQFDTLLGDHDPWVLGSILYSSGPYDGDVGRNDFRAFERLTDVTH